LFAPDLIDKTYFEKIDDGKVDEHPCNKKEFSIELVEDVSY